MGGFGALLGGVWFWFTHVENGKWAHLGFALFFGLLAALLDYAAQHLVSWGLDPAIAGMIGTALSTYVIGDLRAKARKELDAGNQPILLVPPATGPAGTH